MSIPGVALILALVGTLAALPMWISPYQVSFFVTMFMAVTLAGSWNLFSGMTGYVSLGHGLFFGIGAYTFAAATTLLKVHPAVGLVLSALVPALIACVVGYVLLSTRLRIAYFAVIMLGLNEIAKTIVANTPAIGSSNGLTLPPLTNRYFVYYFLAVLAIGVTVLTFAISRSRWGYGLKAIRADEIAAEVTGISTVAHKLAMFVISAVFIGLTGAAIGWNWSYVDPYLAFDLTVSFNMLVMAVFGGFGTVIGPVLGAVAMTVVSEQLATTLPHLHPIVFGTLVILLIIWCPGGLVQAFGILRGKWSGRAAPSAAGEAVQ